MNTFSRIIKKPRVIVAVIFLFVPVASIFAQRTDSPPPALPPPPAVEYNETAWKTFAPPEGGFSILMPGQPVKSGRLIQSAGDLLPYFTFTLRTAMAEYMAGYLDFPLALTEPGDLKTYYDGSRDQMKEILPFKLATERDIYLEGRLGREMIFESEQDIIKARLLLVNRRLFQVLILTRKYQNSPPAIIRFYESTIHKFLDSFKVTDLKVTDKPDVAPPGDLAKVDPGRIENSTYINQYFGLKVSLPSGWHVEEREKSEAILQVGSELLKGSDKQFNAAINKSIANTILLFTFTKVPFGPESALQAAVQCGVQRMNNPGTTSYMYMLSTKKYLLDSSLHYKITRDIQTQPVGGLDFSVLEAEKTSGNVIVKRKYYCTIRKGLALFFAVTYVTEEDRLVLEKMMQTVKFE